MKHVYIAHPLGSGPERQNNRRAASRWVAWAAGQGVVPVAPWIILSGEWDESRREEGLQIDFSAILRCDELWAVGPRVSPGMALEIERAHKYAVFVRMMTGISEADAEPLLGTRF